MKTKYLEIAALLSAAIVTEMASLRAEETYPQRNADEMDDYLGHQREKIRNLHGARMNVEAIAAGYAGGDDDKPEPKQNRNAKDFGAVVDKPMPNEADLASVADEIMKDLLRHGLSVTRINLADLFKDEPETDKAPPSEDKDKTVIYTAGQAAAQRATGWDAAVQTAVDLKFAGK